MATADHASLPYREPDIVTILIITSFLLLSNLVNYALDRLLYCGLIGEILVGIAWGAPGGRWLDAGLQTAIVQLGYLGLICLIYEGGLSTSFQSLKANIILSLFVTVTGITAPISLSFALNGIADATPLQSFAAGAALCSTSLGTTFTILGTTGLLKTRLGVVLTSAAMLDDVVGLVMVQVISNLGGSTSDFSTTTVIRPIFVSIAFAVVCPLSCWLLVRPTTLKLNDMREKNRNGFLDRILSREEAAFFFHTVLLIAMVTGATYAGTSNLFAAYLAGAMISWSDSELPHPITLTPSQGENNKHEVGTFQLTLQEVPEQTEDLRTGTAIFERFYASINSRILKPFFFTSIGFSIPITRMFDGSLVWRGIIYTILMLVGKLLCGAWLIRFSINLPHTGILHRLRTMTNVHVPHLWGKHASGASVAGEPENLDAGTTNDTSSPIVGRPTDSSIQPARIASQPPPSAQPDTISQNIAPAEKPFSLYPAAILGLAMVARGEIGFLVSSLAGGNGIFTTGDDDQIFLIVTWAIVLCTIIGPLCVGLLVRRVKKLERAKEKGGGGRDVLGVWGVE